MALPFFPTHWYYNTESGQLTQGNNLENLGNNLVGGAGWHELNIPGNATVQAAAAEAKKEFPNGHAPTNAGLSPQRVVNAAASDAASAAASAAKSVLGNITGGFVWADAKNFVYRALKVLIGGLLVVVGLVHMTGIDNAATQIVKKVPLPV